MINGTDHHFLKFNHCLESKNEPFIQNLKKKLNVVPGEEGKMAELE